MTQVETRQMAQPAISLNFWPSVFLSSFFAVFIRWKSVMISCKNFSSKLLVFKFKDHVHPIRYVYRLLVGKELKLPHPQVWKSLALGMLDIYSGISFPLKNYRNKGEKILSDSQINGALTEITRHIFEIGFTLKDPLCMKIFGNLNYFLFLRLKKVFWSQ